MSIDTMTGMEGIALGDRNDPRRHRQSVADWTDHWAAPPRRRRRRPYRAALIVAGAALAFVSIVAGTLTALGG